MYIYFVMYTIIGSKYQLGIGFFSIVESKLMFRLGTVVFINMY